MVGVFSWNKVVCLSRSILILSSNWALPKVSKHFVDLFQHYAVDGNQFVLDSYSHITITIEL